MLASSSYPDIDARKAFFEILEKSEWAESQLRQTTDTSQLVRNWLEVRLSDEIHKALTNSKLNSWGEEILPNGATAPERPIPSDTWINVEIEFDRLAVPRTAAHWRTTFGQSGRMAWVGVKFSQQQIFGLFSLAEKISLFEAATHAYEATRHRPFSIFIDGTATTADDALVMYCDEMTRFRNGKPPLVQLWGNMLPSRQREEIYMAPLNRYHFVVENGAVVLRETNGPRQYENLSVNPNQVEAAIRKFSEWEG